MQLDLAGQGVGGRGVFGDGLDDGTGWKLRESQGTETSEPMGVESCHHANLILIECMQRIVNIGLGSIEQSLDAGRFGHDTEINAL